MQMEGCLTIFIIAIAIIAIIYLLCTCKDKFDCAGYNSSALRKQQASLCNLVQQGKITPQQVLKLMKAVGIALTNEASKFVDTQECSFMDRYEFQLSTTKIAALYKALRTLRCCLPSTVLMAYGGEETTQAMKRGESAIFDRIADFVDNMFKDQNLDANYNELYNTHDKPIFEMLNNLQINNCESLAGQANSPQMKRLAIDNPRLHKQLRQLIAFDDLLDKSNCFVFNSDGVSSFFNKITLKNAAMNMIKTVSENRELFQQGIGEYGTISEELLNKLDTLKGHYNDYDKSNAESNNENVEGFSTQVDHVACDSELIDRLAGVTNDIDESVPMEDNESWSDYVAKQSIPVTVFKNQQQWICNNKGYTGANAAVKYQRLEATNSGVAFGGAKGFRAFNQMRLPGSQGAGVNASINLPELALNSRVQVPSNKVAVNCGNY